MGEFKGISESLRRQRADLENEMESTSSRCEEAGRLLDRIEKLRKRTEKTHDSAERRETKREPPR
jgi:hypothetical protein